METLMIDIINPKAKILLNDLADLNLIRISEQNSKKQLQEVLAELRKKSNDLPDLDEISREVDNVRAARYES
jgi:hypothetical protein